MLGYGRCRSVTRRAPAAAPGAPRVAARAARVPRLRVRAHSLAVGTLEGLPSESLASLAALFKSPESHGAVTF